MKRWSSLVLLAACAVCALATGRASAQSVAGTLSNFLFPPPRILASELADPASLARLAEDRSALPVFANNRFEVQSSEDRLSGSSASRPSSTTATATCRTSSAAASTPATAPSPIQAALRSPVLPRGLRARCGARALRRRGHAVSAVVRQQGRGRRQLRQHARAHLPQRPVDTGGGPAAQGAARWQQPRVCAAVRHLADHARRLVLPRGVHQRSDRGDRSDPASGRSLVPGTGHARWRPPHLLSRAHGCAQQCTRRSHCAGARRQRSQ